MNLKECMALIRNETDYVLTNVDEQAVQKLIDGILKADTVFLFGQGRTGHITRAFAVRLMHLGLKVHFVGETTTPPINPNDLCLVNSGTGSTRFSYHVLEAAREAGATTATITAHPDARIGMMADLILTIPAPTKGEDFDPDQSRQPAGSLFEQALFKLLEAIVLMLMEQIGGSRSDLLKRHTNIE